ncbi:DUF411 domain-containing protein [Halovivax sp.]|uniref:DUF411 domain-containing protein n=1 Tax=Halovivax sp. TaxID=1935978 RepID=UPI0025BCCE87|nr:DUF411 domain-containing protein [Halovivax sp.]
MTDTPLSRRALLVAGAVAVGTAAAGCSDGGDPESGASDLDESLAVASATQYQGPSCACCDEYPPYLDEHLDGELAVEVFDEQQALAERKTELGVPRDLWSCHTVVLDGYVFEGHLPVEPIEAFLEAEPDSLGIALPGMPTGSPGMGGEKDETWTIYEFSADGSAEVFTEV